MRLSSEDQYNLAKETILNGKIYRKAGVKSFVLDDEYAVIPTLRDIVMLVVRYPNKETFKLKSPELVQLAYKRSIEREYTNYPEHFKGLHGELDLQKYLKESKDKKVTVKPVELYDSGTTVEYLFEEKPELN